VIELGSFARVQQIPQAESAARPVRSDPAAPPLFANQARKTTDRAEQVAFKKRKRLR
jgi:hypothetical protein